MEPLHLGIIGAGALIVLLLFRVPVAYGLGLVGIAGLTYHYGLEQAFLFIALKLHDYIGNFIFTAVPLFLLMGYFAMHAEVTRDAYTAARIWLGRLPGGLASATVGASALFAACSGSGLPAAAALGRICVPEMIHYNYDPRLATGVVAGSTPLGVLIPPSIIMIIYGVISGTSIARLLIAGIVPGILTSFIFITGITLWAWRKPHIAPPYTATVSWRERFASIRKVWGIALLFLVVIGSIYLGWATPTEAAAFGAFGSMLLALGVRRLSWKNLKQALFDTVFTSSMVFLIVSMATIFGIFMTRSHVIPTITTWMIGLELPLFGFIAGVSILLIILGMFLDGISIMVLIMPVLLPIMGAMDIDFVWFGVLMVLLVDIAAVTPPLGLTVYIVKGVVGDLVDLWDIFRGAAFFLMLWILVLALVIIFPQIALWLPNMMKGAG